MVAAFFLFQVEGNYMTSWQGWQTTRGLAPFPGHERRPRGLAWPGFAEPGELGDLVDGIRRAAPAQLARAGKELALAGSLMMPPGERQPGGTKRLMPLPVGLVYDAAGHVILDPDTANPGRTAAPVHHVRGHRVGHRGGHPRRTER